MSPSVKYRLDINSGTQSNNSYISQMMEYFEVSGVTPQQITKQPIVQIQKRIEDVVKILRSYERDYFKQVIDRDNKEERIPEDYARLMNEMRDLKEKNRQLQQQVSENEKAVSDDNAGYADKLKRLAELVKYQLNPDRFVKVKFSDESRYPLTPCSCSSRRLTRNMYCKAHRPVNTPGVSDNKGKCVQLVEYLSKESQDVRPYYDNFFSQQKRLCHTPDCHAPYRQ